jgi:hypothetical protein
MPGIGGAGRRSDRQRKRGEQVTQLGNSLVEIRRSCGTRTSPSPSSSVRTMDNFSSGPSTTSASVRTPRGIRTYFNLMLSYLELVFWSPATGSCTVPCTPSCVPSALMRVGSRNWPMSAIARDSSGSSRAASSRFHLDGTEDRVSTRLQRTLFATYIICWHARR